MTWVGAAHPDDSRKSLTDKQRSKSGVVPRELGVPERKKHAMIASEPVLFFENQSTNPNPTIELLTIAEVAELLTISVSGTRRLQQARRLPFIKIGGSVRFLKSDIASYIEKQRVGSIDT